MEATVQPGEVVMGIDEVERMLQLAPSLPKARVFRARRRSS
jgi:hypothetical protein